VFHVIEGSGAITIAGQRLTFGARDTFVAPSWLPYSLAADADSVLFSFSDRPVQRALGLWREQLLPA
jgi:gentisate 1,2-dioxygenase